MNISEELRNMKELHDSGALTDEEFAIAKAKVLGIDKGEAVQMEEKSSKEEIQISSQDLESAPEQSNQASSTQTIEDESPVIQPPVIQPPVIRNRPDYLLWGAGCLLALLVLIILGSPVLILTIITVLLLIGVVIHHTWKVPGGALAAARRAFDDPTHTWNTMTSSKRGKLFIIGIPIAVLIIGIAVSLITTVALPTTASDPNGEYFSKVSDFRLQKGESMTDEALRFESIDSSGVTDPDLLAYRRKNIKFLQDWGQMGVVALGEDASLGDIARNLFQTYKSGSTRPFETFGNILDIEQLETEIGDLHLTLTSRYGSSGTGALDLLD